MKINVFWDVIPSSRALCWYTATQVALCNFWSCQ